MLVLGGMMNVAMQQVGPGSIASSSSGRMSFHSGSTFILLPSYLTMPCSSRNFESSWSLLFWRFRSSDKSSTLCHAPSLMAAKNLLMAKLVECSIFRFVVFQFDRTRDRIFSDACFYKSLFNFYRTSVLKV